MGTMGGFFDAVGGMIKVLLAMAVVLLAVLFLGYALGHCQEYGDYLSMDSGNLASAKFYLQNRGQQIRDLYDGIALGKMIDRQSGTGVTAVRGRDKNGRWTCWVWQNEDGELVGQIKVYPAILPKAWKEGKCLP